MENDFGIAISKSLTISGYIVLILILVIVILMSINKRKQ